jgi:hypothetical protein
MCTVVNLYSKKDNEIKRFLTNYFDKEIILENNYKWENKYKNPIEIVDIIGVYIDNNDKYNIQMWISLDKDTFLNITNYNVDSVIRYIYERYPY